MRSHLGAALMEFALAAVVMSAILTGLVVLVSRLPGTDFTIAAIGALANQQIPVPVYEIDTAGRASALDGEDMSANLAAYALALEVNVPRGCSDENLSSCNFCVVAMQANACNDVRILQALDARKDVCPESNLAISRFQDECSSYLNHPPYFKVAAYLISNPEILTLTSGAPLRSEFLVAQIPPGISSSSSSSSSVGSSSSAGSSSSTSYPGPSISSFSNSSSGPIRPGVGGGGPIRPSGP